MSRPLIIGPKEQENIKELVSYAERHPYTIDKLMKVADGRLNPPGDDDKYAVTLMHGFRCVYTHEFQKSGLYRHLSISVPGKGRTPNVHAVQMIANEFGFDGKFSDWIIYLEEEAEAVNVIQRIISMKGL